MKQILVKYILISAVLFVELITLTYSARILGVVPTPSYSHQVAFHPLWRALSLRGHQVTVLTTNPIGDVSLKNLTEIDLGFVYEEKDKMNDQMDSNKLSQMGVFGLLGKLIEFGHNIIDRGLQHPEVQKLIKDENAEFDVVLVETVFPGLAAFATRFKCPLIQIFSLDALAINYYLNGNPNHPVLNPDLVLPFSGKLDFLQRLTSVVYNCFTVPFNLYVAFQTQELAVKKHFGSEIPPLEEILRETSLIFVNTDFILHPIRPLLPNVIQIGGGTHVTSPKPLPKELQTILDNAKQGVIYFSLGNNVRSSSLTRESKKIFLETFSELPYTVLWKFEEDDLPGKPVNVYLSKWFPQQDVFGHPNVKLFISQGGLQSMDEAIHNHIPIIGIPFVGDQKHNVKRMEDKGIGLALDLQTLDKRLLKATILEAMNNPKYRNNMKTLSELAKDQPTTGLERAVWWTEYVIRHKGAKHLRSPALDIPNYQYYLLDVIGFLVLIALIVIYILIKLTKLICKLVKLLLPKRKLKTQ